MTKQAVWLVVLVALVLVGPGWGRLPEEALKRGKEAEKLVQAGKVSEAIASWEKIDKTYPGNPPVSLRLAELHDQTGEYGPALFYYRRYVAQSGEGAGEDARSRLLTLEQMANVPAEAAEYARKRGEDSQPVPVPGPVIEKSRVQVKPDGSIAPSPGAEGGTSVPQVKARAPIVLTPVGDGAKPVSPDTEYVLLTPLRGDSEAAETSEPAAGVRGRTTVTVEPPGAEIPEPGSASARRSPAPGSPETGVEGGTLPPAKELRDEVGRVTDDLKRPKSAFFSVSKIAGTKARIRITNGFGESIMTFAAISGPGAEPVNAILASGESREIDVNPGRYRVKISVSNTGYPPGTLFEADFDMVFETGKCYTRSVSEKNTQRLN